MLGALAAGAALLATVAPIGDAAAQDVPPQFIISQSGWEGGARARSEAGDFSHCDVRRAFSGDRVLIVSLNRRNEINIGLVDPSFEFTPQTGTSTVVMQVDRRLNARVPAAPGGEDILVLAAGDTPELLDALRRGNVMLLETEYGTFEFPLSGTFAAFGALIDCIAVANQILPPEPEPTQIEGEGPQRIGTNAMAALLQAAGIEGALLVPQEQLPVDEMELTQIWLVGDVVGGLHQRDRTTADIEIQGFVDDYLGILEDRCDGEFEATPGEVEVLDERYAFAPVDMLCTGDLGTSVVTAIFVLDDNFYSVFFHEGDETIGDEVTAATDAITALVRQLALDSFDDPPGETEAPPSEEGPEAAGGESEEDGETPVADDGDAPAGDVDTDGDGAEETAAPDETETDGESAN
ncbi:MAG: hypothetical protein AAFX92_04110 [Pseudomonadota bacterium]